MFIDVSDEVVGTVVHRVDRRGRDRVEVINQYEDHGVVIKAVGGGCVDVYRDGYRVLHNARVPERRRIRLGEAWEMVTRAPGS